MRRTAPFSALAAMMAVGQVSAAPRAPSFQSPPPQSMQQQAMPYLNPYDPCTEALEGLRITQTIFPLFGVVYGFADDGISLRIDYSVVGQERSVLIEPRAEAETDSFREAVAKIADLRADAANGSLRMFLYRPMMQETALRLPQPMVALIRPDKVRGTCQAVLHFALPPAPDGPEDDR